MPRLLFTTHVAAPLDAVVAGFNQNLFERLAPPFPPVRVERFDGCLLGDEVHLRLGLGAVSFTWVSLISQVGADASTWWFEDEGKTLPPGLKSWRHRHTVASNTSSAGCTITDDITYQGRTPWLAALLYPSLWLTFAIRGPRYQAAFGRVVGVA